MRPSKDGAGTSPCMTVCVIASMAMLLVLTTTSVMTAVAARGTQDRIGDLADRMIATQAFEGLTDAAEAEKVVMPAVRDMVGGLFDLFVHFKAIHGQDTLDRLIQQAVHTMNVTSGLAGRASKLERALEGAVGGAAQAAAATVAEALNKGAE